MNAPTPSVAFVDLDGALVLENSYHSFVLAMLSHGQPSTRRAIGRCMIRRLSNKDGRVAMKRRLAQAFVGQPADIRARVVSSVVERMHGAVSQPVLHLARDWQSAGATLVLATAALDVYARPIALSLGFDDCIATPTCVDGDWVEAFRETKAELCDRWLADSQERSGRVAMITDSCDDLPLASRASIAVFQGSNVGYDTFRSKLSGETWSLHIDAVGAQAEGGYWLWFDDAPSGPHDRWEVETILSKHRYALLYRGAGTWGRIIKCQDLPGAVKRHDCPLHPSITDRLAVMCRRQIIRDGLGIFH